MEAAEFDLLQALSQSGLEAKLTLLVLGVLSVITWAVWVIRHLAFRKLLSHCADAHAAFLGAPDTASFERRCRDRQMGPISRLFLAAHAEYRDLAAGMGSGESWTPVRAEAGRILLERTLATASEVELEQARAGMALLATIGSTAPFIGLFGTVWGVVDAFGRIGGTGSTDLAVVAPGIAMALVATGAGLLAAIPAVWAHNSLVSAHRTLGLSITRFSTELMNVFDRAVASGTAGGAPPAAERG